MRKLLFESVFRRPLTERAPSLDDAALAELATALGQAARRRLGRSLSIREEVPLGGEAREGMAIVEGFRGDVLVWLRLRNGLIERCHMRDPSWFQWPLLEAVIENNIVADFPLCNKSFNCSYSGHDL